MFSLTSSKTQEPQTKTLSPALVVAESGREICLPPFSLVHLGRRDERRNIYPHIDFTQDGGALYGVSRQHARIHQSERGIYIEDLDSTNGTRLNGQRLTPSQIYLIQHGDKLHLGELQLVVVLSPATDT